jgi:hypothetical protein
MQVADLVASIYSSKCAEHRRVSSGDRKGGDGEEGSGFDGLFVFLSTLPFPTEIMEEKKETSGQMFIMSRFFQKM